MQTAKIPASQSLVDILLSLLGDKFVDDNFTFIESDTIMKKSNWYYLKFQIW